MTTRTSARAREVFDAALELELDARSRFVQRACEDDECLRTDVLSLLAALERRGDALEAGAAAALGMGPIEHGPRGWGEGSAAAERAPEIVGVNIGCYRLVRLIGAGGMGTVYEAVQENPRRTVALKIMHAAGGADSLRRFVEEAQILARLRHPGVAQVFGAGTHTLAGGTPAEAALAAVLGVRRSVPWIAMEFVEGARWITSSARELGLGTRQRLELFAGACDAVHHGHMKGVIHRDLKPANILVDAGGSVKVIDFGVARATDPDPHQSPRTLAASMTGAGSLLGTLRYMSPEQCDGDPHAIDTRSDVYSLGVVLYELLTGSMPYEFGDHSFTTAVRAIREAKPASPSTLHRPLRGDVERIVLKALEKERERRYQSAAEFADDIRRHLADLPIQARPTGAAHRALKFARRNPVLVWMGLLAAMSLVGGAAGVSIALVRAVRAEAAEKTRRGEAERGAYIANLFAAEAAINAHDGGGALARLDAAPESRRGWEWRYLRALADQSTARYVAPDGEALYCASPDDRMVVGQYASGVVRAFDAGMDRVRWSADAMPYGGVPRFSPDGRMVVVTGNDGAMLVDAADGRTIQEFRLPSGVVGLGSAMSPDGSFVAVGCSSGYGVRVYDARTGTQVYAPPAPAPAHGHGWVFSPDFSPDGRFLACSEYPDTVIRAVGSWAEVRRFGTARETEAEPSVARYSPDGRTLAVTTGRSIELHDAADGRLLRTLHGHTQRIHAIDFDAESRRLASGSVDRTVRVWDLVGESEPIVLLGHGAAVNAVQFVPDAAAHGEQLLWSSAAEPVVRVWHPHAARTVAGFAFSRVMAQVHGLTFDRRSRTLAAVLAGEVAEWDAVAGASLGPVRTLPSTYVWGNSDARLVAGVTPGSGLVLYDLDSLEQKWNIAAPIARHALICISPDGRAVSVGIENDVVRVVRSADGSLMSDLDAQDGQVFCSRFTRDSSRLLTGTAGGACRVWIVATGRECASFRVAGHSVYSADMAPDGRLVASGGSDERVHLWDPSTGKELRTLSGFRSNVWSVAFSPDGSRLAVGSQDRVVRLFDVATGDELLQLRRHTGTVMSLAWSPDGRFLATGGYDQRVFVWDSEGTALPTPDR